MTDTAARQYTEEAALPVARSSGSGLGILNMLVGASDAGAASRKIKGSDYEKQFFLNSPYRSMIDKMGTKFLQQVLNKELSDHIKDKMPEIRSELLKKCREADEELDR